MSILNLVEKKLLKSFLNNAPTGFCDTICESLVSLSLLYVVSDVEKGNKVMRTIFCVCYSY